MADKDNPNAESAQKPEEVAESAVEVLATHTNPENDAVAQAVVGTEDIEVKEESIESQITHIPDDFYYDVAEEVSKPLVEENCGLPEGLVKIFHSFGYDAFRRDNLHILDKDCICYVSGNYLEIIKLSTKEKTYIRSTSGHGIGSIDIHPEKRHLAIAEKGTDPRTCIYEYPSLKLFRILRNGTQTAYACAKFNPDGNLLATVGSEPDFLLTIWDWREEHIVLRNKAFSQEIFRVMWSIDLPGILTTAGTGHIKFWIMAYTFTGLKLQGSIGKFGKVELSDIEGLVIMPDGKILTGSEWGNLIVWEGDLIKVQICRKNKAPCHTGLIMQIIMDEGELMTIGTDGYIRTWEFEAIDNAEPPSEGAFFELEPMNELQVHTNSKMMFMEKVIDGETNYWYAQDASGLIWKLDLTFSHTSAVPEPMLSYHSGPIVDCDVSPSSHMAVTIGADARLCVFDLPKKCEIARKEFIAGGSVVIWASPKIDSKSKTIFAGFTDGVVRVLQVGQGKGVDAYQKPAITTQLELIQSIKPHNRCIRAMAFDNEGHFFATSGEDSTVFLFHVVAPRLKAIGFFRLPAIARKLIWLHTSSKPLEPTLLLCLDNSCVIEVKCPDREANFTGTFELFDVFPQRGFRMQSVAGELRVKEEIEQRRKLFVKERDEKRKQLEEAREREEASDEDLLRFDDEEKKAKQKMEEELSLLEPFIPEVPAPILQCTVDKTKSDCVWLSLDGFDAGYLYKCQLKQLKTAATTAEKEDTASDSGETRPISALEGILERLELIKPFETPKLINSDDSPLPTLKFSKTGKRVIFGFQNGAIRVQILNKPFDFSSLGGYWLMALQDNDIGMVNRIQTTYDDSFLLSVGQDGTFFVCELMSEELQEVEVQAFRARIPSAIREAVETDDIDNVNASSIEESRQKAEWTKLVEAGEEKRRDTRRKIAELRIRFKRLKEQNEKLPKHMQIDLREYEILSRIREDLVAERNEKLAILMKETAFESRRNELALAKLFNRFRAQLSCDLVILKSFGTGRVVTTICTNKLPTHHLELLSILIQEAEQEAADEAERRRKAAEADKDTGPPPGTGVVSIGDDTEKHKFKGARGLRLDKQMHMLQASKERREKRQSQWDSLRARKPAKNYEDPADVAAIKYVMSNVGDYQLKSSSRYKVPEHLRRNAKKTRLCLLSAITQIYERQADFNKRVLKLRNKKANVIQQLYEIDSKLAKLANNLPNEAVVIRLKIEDLDDEEFPERAFDATDAKLIDFKNRAENLEPSAPENVQKKAPKDPPKQIIIDNMSSKDERYPPMTVLLQEGHRVLWLPLKRLLEHETYFTLNLPYMHRPEIKGISVASLDPSKEIADSMVYVLRTNTKLQPDDLVINMGLEISPEDLDRNDIETDATPQLSTLPVDTTPENKDEMEIERSNALEVGTAHSIEETSSRKPGPSTKCSINTAPLETLKQITRQKKALYTRDYLVADAGRLVRCFNTELIGLRHQMMLLKYMLQRAELNMLTLYEEYKRLKEFEDGEKSLAQDFEKRNQEKRIIAGKLAEMNTNIEATKRTIEKLSEKDTANFEEFKAFLGDNHKFGDFLQKVFKKKIKRKAKKVNTDGEEVEYDESSSSDDDSEWDEEDEEDEDDMMDLDICPPGCEQGDYDSTVEFREKRLDIEDETMDQKRILDEQRKASDNLSKKARAAENALETSANALQAFQIEKQRKLNLLERVVILKLDQITFFEGKGLPIEFEPALVFKRSDIIELRHRIQSLEDEKKSQRKAKKDAKAKHIMLQRHKKVFQLEIVKMMKHCDLMMIDKFGRLDDLEKMETIMINPKIEEMTAKILSLQAHIKATEEEAENNVREARDCYIAEMKKNTKLLTKTTMLFSELQGIYGALEKQQKTVGKEIHQSGLAEKTELATMLKLATTQVDELRALNAELNCLKQKPRVDDISSAAQPRKPQTSNDT